MKAAALLVGASGVGLIGLFNNLVLTASTFGGLGISSAATRQIAAERSMAGDEGEALARHALARATLVLAVITAVLMWAFSKPIAEIAIGEANYSEAVGWLSIGAGLTIVAGSQTALFAGLRRMNAIARTSIFAGLLATVLGVAALWQFGSRALIPFVLALPLASVFVGTWLVARLPSANAARPSFQQIWSQWRQLVGLGSAIMLAQLLGNGAQLAARGLIGQRLGLAELGLFQAAWTVSMTYLGLVLQAMSVDFYPRLSEAIGDRSNAARIVNEQTEVALLLAGPLIVAAIGLAPWALHLLYAEEFRGAADLLRLQMLGDVLKVSSWPLGFALLAARRNFAYLAVEITGWLVFGGTIWLLLPAMGLEAAGAAFVLMYAVYAPVTLIAVRRLLGFGWSVRVIWQITGLIALSLLVFAVASYDSIIGAAVSVTVSGALAVWAFKVLKPYLRTVKKQASAE